MEICKIAFGEPEPKPEYWQTQNLQADKLYNLADFLLEKYYKSETQMCYYKFVYLFFLYFLFFLEK